MSLPSRTTFRIGVFALLVAFLAPVARAAAPMPIFDAHLHYNAEAREPYPLSALRTLFETHGIQGILANSRPNNGTRALVDARFPGLWVVPFIRPYVVRPDRYTWFDDPAIYDLIESEFRRGDYQGIGEFHLFGQDAASPWVKKTVDFAVRHDLYLHAHSDETALEILFAHNPKVKIIWAHTGFTTSPERIEAYFMKYPSLWGELSYRYDVSSGGRLDPAWKALLERHSNRFLLGSDTWVNERWASYGEIIAGYRSWLAELAPQAAERIAWKNAAAMFRR